MCSRRETNVLSKVGDLHYGKLPLLVFDKMCLLQERELFPFRARRAEKIPKSPKELTAKRIFVRADP